MKRKTYEETIQALSDLVSVEYENRPKDLLLENSMATMGSYITRLGMDITKIKFIHVAGTKGKGSTCTYVSAIMSQSGVKTGLFCSPHIVKVTEMFQINGVEISKDDFVDTFWSVFNKLNSTKNEEFPSTPVYFMVLTLMAFKYFIDKSCQVAVIEVGMGGKLDSTNILFPTVCAIAHIELDHVLYLGNTLKKIAAHKAGIIKKNVPIITYEQSEGVLEVFEEFAKKSNAQLLIAPKFDSILKNQDIKIRKSINPKMTGQYQKKNMRLAMSVCKKYFQIINKKEETTKGFSGTEKMEIFKINHNFVKALNETQLLARCQIVKFSDNITFYLDGAHTSNSIQLCCEWFFHKTKEKKKILAFGFSGSRKPSNLLEPLVKRSSELDYVRFVPKEYDYNSRGLITKTTIDESELERVKKMCECWEEFSGGKNYEPNKSIEEFMEWVKKFDEEVHVLVTGSLYLCGDFLKRLLT